MEFADAIYLAILLSVVKPVSNEQNNIEYGLKMLEMRNLTSVVLAVRCFVCSCRIGQAACLREIMSCRHL